MATQSPSKPVAVKTEGEHAVLALHRLRQQKIIHTMQMNCLQGLLTEYGEVMAKSRAALDRAIPGEAGRASTGDADRHYANFGMIVFDWKNRSLALSDVCKRG